MNLYSKALKNSINKSYYTVIFGAINIERAAEEYHSEHTG